MAKLFGRSEQRTVNPIIIGVLITGVILIGAAVGLSVWYNFQPNALLRDLGVSLPILDSGETESSSRSRVAVDNTVVQPSQESSGEEDSAAASRPSFDILRVGVGGETVAAGRAPPGSEVVLYRNGSELATVSVDDRGEWVFLGQQPLDGGEYQFNVSARLGDDEVVAGIDDIVVLVPERPLVLEGGKSPQRPLVMLIPGDEERAARILQRQFSSEAPVGPHFTVDAAEFSENSELRLLGSIQAEQARLVAYINDNFLDGIEVAGEGASPVDWSLATRRSLRPGRHQLRVDMVVDERVVLRRVLPFVVNFSSQFDIDEGVFIVAEGDSLWQIAKLTLGEGTRYTLIYWANESQITDPDLIYPGQRFRIPDEELKKYVEK